MSDVRQYSIHGRLSLPIGSVNIRGQSDVSEGDEHFGCPPVAGPWVLLLTDMFDSINSKFGVSFPPHSDNLSWKFTRLCC